MVFLHTLGLKPDPVHRLKIVALTLPSTTIAIHFLHVSSIVCLCAPGTSVHCAVPGTGFTPPPRRGQFPVLASHDLHLREGAARHLVGDLPEVHREVEAGLGWF